MYSLLTSSTEHKRQDISSGFSKREINQMLASNKDFFFVLFCFAFFFVMFILSI